MDSLPLAAFAAILNRAPIPGMRSGIAPAFIAEGHRESSSVKVRAPRAVFVDDALVSKSRPAILIQLRQLAHRDVFQDHREQVIRIGRAARQIDDRLSGNDGIDAHRPRWIRIGRGQPLQS